MNNDELKKKIVDILSDNIRWVPYYFISRGIVYDDDLKNIADALIDAGIGDVKEAENRARAAEFAAKTVTDKAIRKYKEMKHRAEVAERALDLCETAYILALNGREHEGISQQAIVSDLGVHGFFMQQAEKELSEEEKLKYDK